MVLELGIMVGLVVATMLIIWLFPKITKADSFFISCYSSNFGDSGSFRYTHCCCCRHFGSGETIKGTFPPLTIPIIDLNWQTLSLIFPFAQLWRVWAY